MKNYILLIRSFFGQRIIVYLVAIYFALILFNTTYMSLGTYVPLTVMLLAILTIKVQRLDHFNNQYQKYFLYLPLIILFATTISGGDNFRDIFKIFFTIVMFYYASSVKYTEKEVRFLSFAICVGYLVYAYLVFRAIGGSTALYGRVTLRILNSEEFLDPNVVSATFILPVMICLYNILYGKHKILAGMIMLLFLIAIIALGSRGSTVAIVISSAMLLYNYVKNNKSNMVISLLLFAAVGVIIVFAVNYMSQQSDIFGLDRSLAFDEDDEGGGRIPVWIERMQSLFYSPIWGYGTNLKISGLHSGMANHNTFVQILHFSGILGFVMFLKPILKVIKRTTVSKSLRNVLFASVFISIFFIDTLQERTLWNFLLYYWILSAHENADKLLLWESND